MRALVIATCCLVACGAPTDSNALGASAPDAATADLGASADLAVQCVDEQDICAMVTSAGTCLDSVYPPERADSCWRCPAGTLRLSDCGKQRGVCPQNLVAAVGTACVDADAACPSVCCWDPAIRCTGGVWKIDQTIGCTKSPACSMPVPCGGSRQCLRESEACVTYSMSAPGTPDARCIALSHGCHECGCAPTQDRQTGCSNSDGALFIGVGP